MEGATPPRRVLIVRHCVRRLTLAGDAPASKKGGSLPPPAPFLCGASSAADGEGTREAQPRFAVSRGTREIRVVPCPMRSFSEVLHHNGEGGAL